MKRLMLTTAMALAMTGTAMAQDATGNAATMDTQAPAANPGADATVVQPLDGAAQSDADRMAQIEADRAAMEAGAPDAPMTDAPQGEMQVPGFLASDFAGMSLYALNPEGWGNQERADARWTSGEAIVAERDNWDDIGKINDTIITQDGEVRGVLIDIGGFLGIGAKTVMVGMDDLYFVPNDDTPEVLSDFYAVAGVTREQLEALPEWSEETLVAGYPWGGQATQAQPGALPATVVPSEEGAEVMEEQADAAEDAADAAAVDTTVDDTNIASTPMPVEPPANGELVEGDQGTPAVAVPASEPGAMPTAEELVGVSLVDASGERVGEVEDVVLDQAVVSAVVADIGGFLGIGERRVALPFDGLTVVREEDGTAIDNIQVGWTREQLEALPVYE